MPILGKIKWGVAQDSRNPFGDPRLRNLDIIVQDLRRGRLPFGWRGNRIFENRGGALPNRAYGYYKEYYLGVSADSGSLRVVLGEGGEVYVTGNHYSDFIQVLHLPYP